MSLKGWIIYNIIFYRIIYKEFIVFFSHISGNVSGAQFTKDSYFCKYHILIRVFINVLESKNFFSE